MTDVAAALPQYTYGPQPAAQQFGPPQGMMYPMPPHMPSFPGPAPGSVNMPYPMGYQNPYAQPHQHQSTAQFAQGTPTGSAYGPYPPYPHPDASTNNPGYSPSYSRQGSYPAGSTVPSKQSGPRHGQSPPKSDKERKEGSSDTSWTIVDGSRQASRSHTPGKGAPFSCSPFDKKKKKKQELPLTQAGQDLVLLGAQRLRRPESLNNLVMLYGLVISHRARTWSISRTTLPAMPLMTLKVFF